MIDIRLGIVGGGVVGSATARSYTEHVKEVRVYDVIKERRTHELEHVLECDLIMVCLPTPQVEGLMDCDVRYVEEFFRHAASFHANANFVLRSTVPVGFTRRLADTFGLKNLVHSPEFLTARCANVDAQMPSRNIVGERPMKDMMKMGFIITPMPWTQCGIALRDLYAARWPHVPVEVVPSDMSEFVKLATNSIFAAKVGVFNELYEFCSFRGIDWELAHDLILKDGRIHPSHTQVPGPDGNVGFGGSCLPKDLASLVIQMIEDGVSADALLAVHKANKRRRPE